MTNGFKLENGILTTGDLRYIQSQQFALRDDIYKAVIGPGVGFLEGEAFAECENLEAVILPEGLINISVAAFASCAKLSKINIPSTVKHIEEGAFLFCDSLRHIDIPDGVESINDLCFQSSGLEDITIPESCTYIGEEAFFECENLREANVLCKDASIGLNAFGSNYNLLKGYIAPGYSGENSQTSNLLFTLLWASCPERHNDATAARAREFISKNESLVFERILKFNNVPAMTGIASTKAFNESNIDKYVSMSSDEGLTEITALLLKAKGSSRLNEGDFDL